MLRTTLNDTQYAQLRQLARAAVGRVSERAHWREVKGLYDAPHAGRPAQEKLLTGIVQAQASQSPSCYGYRQVCWTVALLLTHLRQYLRIHVGATTLRQALHRAGLRWTRPKLALPRKPDPQAESKRTGLTEVLGDPQATLIAEDESDVSLTAG